MSSRQKKIKNFLEVSAHKPGAPSPAVTNYGNYKIHHLYIKENRRYSTIEKEIDIVTEDIERSIHFKLTTDKYGIASELLAKNAYSNSMGNTDEADQIDVVFYHELFELLGEQEYHILWQKSRQIRKSYLSPEAFSYIKDYLVPTNRFDF